MGTIEQLWTAGEMPFHDGLYRPDDTGLELYVDGPGAYHPNAGQPIPFRLGGPLDVARAIAYLATDESSYVSGETFSVNGGPQLGGPPAD